MKLILVKQAVGKHGVGYLVGLDETAAGFLGEILPDVDGLYVWWPGEGGGFMSEDLLRSMADKLKELNAPIQQAINDYFDLAEKLQK